MGVPITFLDKYTPKQFEVVKFRQGNDDKDLTYTTTMGAGGGVKSLQTAVHSSLLGLIDTSKVTPLPAEECASMVGNNMSESSLNDFEILGLLADNREKSEVLLQGIPTYVDERHKKRVEPVINKKSKYARIIIKRRHNANRTS